MNQVLRERITQLEVDRADWRRLYEKKSMDSEIMSHARFFEDHGDAVERSGFAELICSLLDQVYGRVRTQELLAQLSTSRKQIEDEISSFEGDH